jgi:hypothetical protein
MKRKDGKFVFVDGRSYFDVEALSKNKHEEDLGRKCQFIR